ncbi:hypothetical protein B0H10DRAFT_1967790 [Mycena sp. CBHHK59/15]|nr:hypothetical protein B0H10DRAFT_1967790 [Mycena sp. CBHHK59/15]
MCATPQMLPLSRASLCTSFYFKCTAPRSYPAALRYRTKVWETETVPMPAWRICPEPHRLTDHPLNFQSTLSSTLQLKAATSLTKSFQLLLILILDDYPKTMPFCDALPDAETMPVNLKVSGIAQEVSTWMFGSAIPQVNVLLLFNSTYSVFKLLGLVLPLVTQVFFNVLKSVKLSISSKSTYFGEIWKTAGAMPVHLETMPMFNFQDTQGLHLPKKATCGPAGPKNRLKQLQKLILGRYGHDLGNILGPCYALRLLPYTPVQYPRFQGIIVNWIPRREFAPGTTYAAGKQAPPRVVRSGWHGTYPLSTATPIWLSTPSSAVTGHN